MLDSKRPTQPLPTRVGNRSLAALILLALAAAGAVAWAMAPGPPAGERLILYFESDSPPARKIHARFVQSLAARLPAAIPTRTEFIATNTGDALGDILRRELRREPAVIVATSGFVAIAAKAAAPGTPMVFATNADPVATGLVRDINRPGGSSTGIMSALPTFAKRVEILLEALPSARHVGVLLEAGDAPEDLDIPDRTLPRRDGLTFHWLSADSAASARSVIAAASARVEAWYIPYNGIAFFHGDDVLAALAEAKRPAIFERVKFADAGGLLAYQHTVEDPADRLASMVASILQGVPPGEIPVVRPRRFELVVNLDAARALGLTLPKSVVKRADRVIER